jgi:hypothetical protein
MIISDSAARDIAASARVLHDAFSHLWPGSSIPAVAVRQAIPALLQHELDGPEPECTRAGQCRYCLRPVIQVHERWYTAVFNARGDLKGELLCPASEGGRHSPRARR